MGLPSSVDSKICDVAASGNWMMVSKDSDYVDRSLTMRVIYKVIYLRSWNRRTSEIEALLSRHQEVNFDFAQSDDEVVLIIEFQPLRYLLQIFQMRLAS